MLGQRLAKNPEAKSASLRGSGRFGLWSDLSADVHISDKSTDYLTPNTYGLSHRSNYLARC